MAQPDELSPIQQAPPELKDLAVSYLGCQDLKSLRLTCRAIEPIASSRLFRRITLSRLQNCCDAFFGICASPRLADHVKELVWYEFTAAEIELAFDSYINRSIYFFGVPADSYLVDILRPEATDSHLFWLTDIPAQGDALEESHSEALLVFRRIFLEALERLPNLQSLASCSMPPDQIMMSYPLTCRLARNLSHYKKVQGNYGFFEFLVPALFHLGDRVTRLDFENEEGLYFDDRIPNRLDRPAFVHLKSIRLCLHSKCLLAESWTARLAGYLQSARGLQDLDLVIDTFYQTSPPYQQAWFNFSQIFLYDVNTGDITRWAHLRSLRIEGLLVTSTDLVAFVRAHVATLRNLRLRDCSVSSDSIPTLATITGLHLFSFRVEASSGVTFSDDDGKSIPIVSEESLLRFVNQETDHNPLANAIICSGTRHYGEHFLFATCLRQWRDTHDLRSFAGYIPKNRDDDDDDDDEGPSDQDFDPEADEVYEASEDSNGYISLMDDEEVEVWRNPPYWTWGRFYNQDPTGKFYFWQVPPGTPGSYRTTIWRLTHHDGKVVFVEAPVIGAMEPPEEIFEDWDDDSAENMIEPTPYSSGSLFLGKAHGDGPSRIEVMGQATGSVWKRSVSECPPDEAIEYKQEEDPMGLVGQHRAPNCIRDTGQLRIYELRREQWEERV